MDTLADALTYWTPERMTALRKKHGLTQPAWAKVLGYDHAQSVSDVENGRRNPSQAICRVLDYIETYGILPSRDESE